MESKKEYLDAEEETNRKEVELLKIIESKDYIYECLVKYFNIKNFIDLGIDENNEINCKNFDEYVLLRISNNQIIDISSSFYYCVKLNKMITYYCYYNPEEKIQRLQCLNKINLIDMDKNKIEKNIKKMSKFFSKNICKKCGRREPIMDESYSEWWNDFVNEYRYETNGGIIEIKYNCIFCDYDLNHKNYLQQQR